MLLQERISACYEGLTPVYATIADFILNNLSEAAFMTAAELAQATGAEPNTVLHFAEGIGYESYSALTQEIKEYIQQQAALAYQAEATKEGRLLTRIQANTLHTFQYLTTVEAGAIEQAFNALQKATRVWVAGDFVAYEMAHFFVQQLQSLRKSATLLAPTLTEMATFLTQMQPEHLLFVIGFGHAVMDLGYLVHLAHQKGLTVICLAHHTALYAVGEGDIEIVIPITQSVGPMSFVAPLTVLSWLWEALGASDPEKMAGIFTAMQSVIGEIREWRKESLRELAAAQS